MRRAPLHRNICSLRPPNVTESPQTRAAQNEARPSFGGGNYYASLLKQCASEKSITEARRIHSDMKESGFPHLSLGNKLIATYLKCGCVDDARKVFDEMPRPHIVSWNSMISSYIHHRRTQEAIRLYQMMLPMGGVMADEFTFSAIFRAFSSQDQEEEGLLAHGQLVVSGLDSRNVFIGSSLVHMYARFGRLAEAKIIYDRISQKDVVLSTALIVGCTQNGEDEEAIRVYEEDVMMITDVEANESTYASVLIACGNLGRLRKGMLIHGAIIKTGFGSGHSSQTSLLAMYAKCGLIDDSLKVFSHIVNPTSVVTWTAVIGVLARGDREEAALSMLRRMMRDSIQPNAFTLSTALQACSSLALILPGKLIHAHAIKIGLDRDRFVGATLIDTYAKCGSITMARSVFHDLPVFDLVSVNSLIHGYAQNGYGHEAIRLFDLLLVETASGFENKPDDATFTSVLTACANAGLLEEGHRIFSSIAAINKHGPSIDHYTCLVDLLGRAGRLEEAERLILTLVRNPDAIMWRTLLGASKIHGDVEMAERAAKKVLELDPGDEGTHVLLSNLYASSGQWNEVIKIKTVMRGMRLKKDPAMSWVEVGREVHTFMAGEGNESHPRAAEIHEELGRLIEKTRGLGYVPDTRFVLQELDEVDKRRSLYLHSERLAIAFAVLSGSPVGEDARPPRIVIFKNLRVCGDCHTWIKLVSRVVGREITARDAKRFHHFSNGFCSCGDYW